METKLYWWPDGGRNSIKTLSAPLGQRSLGLTDSLSPFFFFPASCITEVKYITLGHGLMGG